MGRFTSIRLYAAALLGGLSLALTGCLVSPGKFTSELTLLDNNEFTFTYEGEVFFLGLSSWIKAQQERERYVDEFEAYCYGPVNEDEDYDADYYDAELAAEAVAEAAEAAAEEAAEAVEAAAEEAGDDVSSVRVTTMAVAAPSSDRRDCTEKEAANQRKRWEERQERRRERDKEQAEQIASLIGGIDPTDPQAEQKLAKILLRQKGFEKVEVRGNGLFYVSYRISGTLDHDYMFPMMEDFPTTNPFVQLFLRDGNQVRVNALGFAPPSVNSPMASVMMSGPLFGSARSSEMEAFKEIPPVDGTFSIVTTGDILANNTDEGPVTQAGRKRLTWTIDGSSKAAPTALIELSR